VGPHPPAPIRIIAPSHGALCQCSGKSLKLLLPDVTFKAEMHQIRFRLGLRPRSRWGSLQRSPRPPSWILGVLLLREGGEGEGEGKGRRRETREGEKGERKAPTKFSHTPVGGF